MNPPAAYNQYWLLNSVNGWRASAALDELAQNGTGALTLQTLPGEAQPFTPDLAGKVICPTAVVWDECDRIYVLDAAAARVVRIDPPGQIQTIVSFGGVGSQPRQLRAPRGLAVARGALTVSDTGNHRVQVFSPPPYALIQLWGRAGAQPGDGALEFRNPWGVATDQCGHVYVADRGNRRVQKVGLDGTWLATLGTGTLKDPTELAVSRKGVVAVVDGAAQGSGGTVQMFPPNAAAPTPLPKIEQPRAVAFDASENLYVATARGLVFHYAPDPTQTSGYAYVGAGVTGLDSSAVSMTWAPGSDLLGIFLDANVPGRQIWSIPTAGSYVCRGILTTEALDSGIEDCPWDRVTLLGAIPDCSNVTVEYFTSNDPKMGLVSNPNDGPPYTFVGDQESGIRSQGSGVGCQAPGARSGAAEPWPLTPDACPMTCLVQAQPGQYLRLRITFTSGGTTTPTLSAVKVFFPRQSYLQYLPAVYQEDPDSRAFLDRFLSIFQSAFDEFDMTIDTLWRLFNPDSVPPQFLDWLAAWIQLPLDPTWPLAKKRAMLKKAARDYRRRGTLGGLLQAIKDYSGVSDGLAIIEHFRLRQCLRHWPILPTAGPVGGGARLWSRQFYERLQVGTFSQVGAFALTDRPEPAAEAADWGANEFSVFFPADPYDPEATTAKVAAAVEREKPAHTSANVVPVLPRFRVGVQATLGVDTRVGGYTHLVLGNLSRLNYDAILACSPPQRDIEKLGASVRPITGVTTRLC
jgi:phage tail-like protein